MLIIVVPPEAFSVLIERDFERAQITPAPSRTPRTERFFAAGNRSSDLLQRTYPPGRVACSSTFKNRRACSTLVPHISAAGFRLEQTDGRSGLPNKRQRSSASS
jgi:hypothetical protein